MGMENIIFNGFLLDVSIDQNSEAVSVTFVSWILSLFGPDLIRKPVFIKWLICAYYFIQPEFRNILIM